MYPPFIYSAIWSVDLVVFAISPIELNQVHAITSWVITVGALVFSIGGWLTRLAHAAVFTTWARIAPRAVRILGLLIGFVPGADFVEVMW